MCILPSESFGESVALKRPLQPLSPALIAVRVTDESVIMLSHRTKNTPVPSACRWLRMQYLIVTVSDSRGYIPPSTRTRVLPDSVFCEFSIAIVVQGYKKLTTPQDTYVKPW